MKNRYPGNCSLCGKLVPPKQGRWRDVSYYQQTQNFGGLRCKPCSTTTVKGLKAIKNKIKQNGN